MSIETDAESSSTFPDKPVTTSSDDFPKPMRRLFVSEPDSEPLPPPPSDALLPPTPAGAVGDKPSTNPDKQIDQEQSPIALRPADLNAGSALNAPRNAVMTPSPIEGRQSGQSRADKSATPSRTAGTVLKKPGASSQAPAGSQKKAMTNGLQIAKTSIDAPRREANKSVKNSLGTKRGETAPTTRMTTTALRPRPSPNISTTTHKLQPSKGTGHGDAIIKPKPKSTTKPVNIPFSLTAPTASSVSKSSALRQSHSQQSGSLQNPNASSHLTTRANPSSAFASAQLAGRPKSAMSRPKPSVSLPPSKSLEPDVVVTKRSSHVDEGFLARMMRPTQASSLKTAEKTPSTPPKKAAPRLSTAAAERNPRQATNARRLTLAKDETREKSESNSSQQAEFGRASVDIMRELSLAEPIDQVTSVPQDVSGAPTAEGPQSPGNELRSVARLESGDVEAASSSPGCCDPTEPQVQPQNATSPIACVETAEEAIDLAQHTSLAQQPVQLVQLVNVNPLPCASPVDESASGLPSFHVTGGGCQVDVGESATTHGGPPLVSPDLSEPSKPPADIVNDEEIKAKESVAEGIEHVSTSSTPDAMKDDERIDNDATMGSPRNAESPCEPPGSGFDSPLPMAQKTKTSGFEH